MTERRQRTITVLPSGLLLDETAFRDWLSQIDARAPKRAVVRRLSLQDPEIMAFEATSRGRAA